MNYYLTLHARFMPPAVQEDFLAVSYFYSELQKVLVNSREANLALGKVDYWRSSLDKIYAVR